MRVSNLHDFNSDQKQPPITSYEEDNDYFYLFYLVDTVISVGISHFACLVH